MIADQLGKLQLESGLGFRIGRIDGSIYGGMILRDVRVNDTQGVFATAQEIRLDWRPLSYLKNRIDIRNLESPEIRLARLPALKPSGDPNAPLLPDLNIDVARVNVARIDIAPAVDGQRHIARLSGSAHLAGGRAQLVADAGTLMARGVAGGDRLTLRLDAVPSANRLDIDLAWMRRRAVWLRGSPNSRHRWSPVCRGRATGSTGRARVSRRWAGAPSPISA